MGYFARFDTIARGNIYNTLLCVHCSFKELVEMDLGGTELMDKWLLLGLRPPERHIHGCDTMVHVATIQKPVNIFTMNINDTP